MTDNRGADHPGPLDEVDLIAIFEAAPDGLAVVGPRGVILSANQRMADFFRYSRAELIGQSIEMLVPEDRRGHHVKDRAAFAENPAPRPMGISMELTGRRSDGSHFPIEVSLSPLPGAAGRVICAVRDVTNRARLRAYTKAAMDAAEEERRRIARELHDDTAQVLSALLLRFEAVLRTDDAEVRDRLQGEIREGLRGAAEGVRRIARGLRPPALEDAGVVVAIRGHLRNAVDPIEGISTEFHSEGVEHLLTSEAKLVLYRVIQEAVSNAVRHAKATSIRIDVVAGSGHVAGTVADNGIGFDAEALAEGDRGLGLIGMHERAGGVGGRLIIDSRPGEGTRVRLEIPARENGEQNG